ncbi:hypothetical protein BC832DRAFT_537787 [Gaertneriomyces semiglobifer]|nr:hypothetical protein BC832DRAFT_537787 [Gaertneriomyces semiglobifer]
MSQVVGRSVARRSDASSERVQPGQCHGSLALNFKDDMCNSPAVSAIASSGPSSQQEFLREMPMEGFKILDLEFPKLLGKDTLAIRVKKPHQNSYYIRQQLTNDCRCRCIAIQTTTSFQAMRCRCLLIQTTKFLEDAPHQCQLYKCPPFTSHDAYIAANPNDDFDKFVEYIEGYEEELKLLASCKHRLCRKRVERRQRACAIAKNGLVPLVRPTLGVAFRAFGRVTTSIGNLPVIRKPLLMEYFHFLQERNRNHYENERRQERLEVYELFAVHGIYLLVMIGQTTIPTHLPQNCEINIATTIAFAIQFCRGMRIESMKLESYLLHQTIGEDSNIESTAGPALVKLVHVVRECVLIGHLMLALGADGEPAAYLLEILETHRAHLVLYTEMAPAPFVNSLRSTSQDTVLEHQRFFIETQLSDSAVMQDHTTKAQTIMSKLKEACTAAPVDLEEAGWGVSRRGKKTSWVICFTYATWFGLEALASVGESHQIL